MLDGSQEHVKRILHSEDVWKHDLTAQNAFVTAENIDGILQTSGFTGDIGILHIDIDGNDVWIWKAIKCATPVVVIVEYNSILPAERPIAVPYRSDFQRRKAHFSNIYYGASLAALRLTGKALGYSFIGTNSSRNNAYFLRNDYLNPRIPKVGLEMVSKVANFSEARDQSGALGLLRGNAKLEMIKGLPVVNMLTGEHEFI